LFIFNASKIVEHLNQSTNMLSIENQEELFFRVALSFVRDIGDISARSLLAHFGSAKNIFKTKKSELRKVHGIGDYRVNLFDDKAVFEKAENELKFCEKERISIIDFSSPKYPKRFMNCMDAPLLLYHKGSADLNAHKVIAIIGTRKNSDYGERCCELLFEDLTGIENVIVVSGLALGIDTFAHKKSLKKNIPTVGVLGHSLDMIYPHSNRELAKEMLEHGGGLLTEFPSGTKPDKQNFPVRNRIVAGMCDVTVVVESDIKGGAMITAYVAHSYGREIAAFPGRVFDNKSVGTNNLIKKNIAAMITNGNDLLELMNWQSTQYQSKVIQSKLFEELNADESILIELLKGKDSVHSDELMQHSKFTYSLIASLLLQLELKGLIKTLPGKNYRLN
jgi:DNA processing protein